MAETCLTLGINELCDLGGACTTQEIAQQPALWRHTVAQIEAFRPDIDAFLVPLLKKENLRVVFTGAASSAFAGDILAPHPGFPSPLHSALYAEPAPVLPLCLSWLQPQVSYVWQVSFMAGSGSQFRRKP